MNIISRPLSGVERTFSSDELIVSKTDTKGVITYANDIFIKMSGYTEAELLGQPHSLIRHPDMPRCVFKFLWDTIATGQEVFAYVVNRAKPGDHYWVFAHVTANYNRDRQIIGYSSNRRSPKKSAIDAIKPIYAQLLAEEQRHADRKAGLEASFKMLVDVVKNSGMSYEKLIFAL
ncbi:MAG: PAS domain-containing protein [Rhodospirillales bacterium]|nr:PAS domain-containing protein [Rhodospirillales bacterium]